jgi:hypothetical protein
MFIEQWAMNFAQWLRQNAQGTARSAGNVRETFNIEHPTSNLKPET